MELNRENILRKTHYGLNIYSHVLSYYYPDETVLSLFGRDCLPAKNPFNGDKPTLMVKIVDNIAFHSDTELTDFKGDVFDFAALHFKLKDAELLEKLNELCYLRLGEPPRCSIADSFPGTFRKPEPYMIKLPVFSYFKAPVSNIVPSKNISLLDVFKMIKGDMFLNNTTNLRILTDKIEARKYKAANFDYVTFSGTFSERNDKALRKHSGLMAIDFDHIPDLSELKYNLLRDEYFETEILFYSPSGDGLKWIIPVDLAKASHQDYFKAVAAYILQCYQVKVDQSGKDISRACFLPYYPDVYINPKYW